MRSIFRKNMEWIGTVSFVQLHFNHTWYNCWPIAMKNWLRFKCYTWCIGNNNVALRYLIANFVIYNISQEICTRFCCALLCCGYAIVHNEFTWSTYPYSSRCFAGTGAIVRLPQCQWSKPDGYGKISQCITTTNHSKAKTVCMFLGIYCTYGIC